MTARLEQLLDDAARRLVDGGVRRLIAVDGATSGAIVPALDTQSLAIGAEIDPGVPALRPSGRVRVLALGAGNFGNEDLFDEAGRVLRGEARVA